MINNRQGGRRRGRGGQRQGGGGQPGNRQDNRQRGNAAQLLEKYKSMARDAQLAGDRVQSEYYLQFADHYFRVLGESQRRFEDQRRQRGDDGDEDDDGDQEFEGAEEADAQDNEPDDRPERQPRGGERSNRRPPRPQRHADGDEQDDRDERDEHRPARANGRGETIPFDALPPAIGRDEQPDGADEEAAAERKPRRRTRAVRPADDEDVAPAA